MDKATAEDNEKSASLLDPHDLKHGVTEFHIFKKKFPLKARALRWRHQRGGADINQGKQS
jgi:hypothetical protein